MAIYLGNKLVSPSTKAYSTNKIGEIIQMVCSSTYVPFGCLPCDGSEYTKAQFSELWTNFLIDGKLNTCSYSDFNSSLTTYGQCGKFAVDTTNEKFKTPYIKDGAYLTQARTDTELGKAYNESLPNITGTFGGSKSYNSTGAFTELATTKNMQSGTNASRVEIGFDASLSSSTYQDNAKVQGDNIRTRFFVVVANGQVNQSTIDWSEWASSLQGKANTDADNFSTTGESYLSGLGMPSNTYDDLTLGASGATYTAPANGWFALHLGHSSNQVNIYMYNTTTRLGNGLTIYTNGWDNYISIPVVKNDEVSIAWGGSISADHFRFIYAEGEN